jgi:UDP-N-acetylglucosamine--N-acetylmuramyl-(pentapeptide) pyrophosphoryl-undecaprenol N-acetylglucosamine transferase
MGEAFLYMKTFRILVTGGGSSGHISPALSIIKTLDEMAAASQAGGASTAEAWQPQYLYLGGKRGLEKEIVEAAGIPFAGVETGKLRRYLSRENVTDLGRIPVGVLQSIGLVKKFRPHVVLATGGYVAVPPVMAARLLKVPVVIHEQTVQVGLANRINARCATRIALAFESAKAELLPAQRSKAVVVGNPVRSLVFGGKAERAAAWAGFGAEDQHLPTLYVTGGSQGARVINRAVEAALPELLAGARIIHQCGQQPAGSEQDYDRLEKAAAALSPELRRRYHFTRFIRDEVGDVFALADLVVSRAGAGTISEICALGKPALYVPLVPTGGDEQTRNAAMCVEEGAARVIRQSEIDGPSLQKEVTALLGDRAELDKMAVAARRLARPNAARELAEIVLQLAGGVK